MGGARSRAVLFGDSLRQLATGWPAVVAALIAYAVSLSSPILSPLIVALVFGMILANTRAANSSVLAGSAKGAKTLLRWGVVLLGAQLTWQAVVALGVQGVVIAVVTVVVVYWFTCWLGDRLGLEKGLVTMIAAGFSICGAAAIAAVESSIKRRDSDVALALAMVTLCGTVMIVVVPALGSWAGLSELQIGVWAGASIHEVAQVVAAASIVGTTALATAMTVKLARVALLAVAVGASAWRHREASVSGKGGRGLLTYVPWFLIGFFLVAAANSVGLFPEGLTSGLSTVSQVLLAAGMFGLGLGIRLKQLFPMPWNVVLLSLGSTAVAAVVSLALVLLLW